MRFFLLGLFRRRLRFLRRRKRSLVFLVRVEFYLSVWFGFLVIGKDFYFLVGLRVRVGGVVG